jgi:hypothetical protein
MLAFVFLLVTVGCVRRDGRNADCQWPSSPTRRDANPRHISADAEFAEDLAIRYADAHFGHSVSGEEYEAARDRCMATLFAQVASEHGVTVEQVSSSLGRNREYIDLAEILPFALLCCFAASAVARKTWRRYSPGEHGWAPGVTMAFFLSVVFAAGATLLGEVWCGIAETHRIGNNHMSHRFARLLWARRRAEFFAGALLVFGLAAVEGARHLRSDDLSGP